MRPQLALALLALAAAPPAMAQAPQTDDEKAAYTLGVQAARGLNALGLPAKEVEMAKRGFADAIAGKPKVDPAQYAAKAQDLAKKRLAAQVKVNAEKGQALLAKAAAEPGAQKTASGVVVVTTKEGSGAVPTLADTARVQYQGKLPDGTVFDSSVKRGQPGEVALAQAIPCWSEGLRKMKVGGKAKLVCPASAAYGDAGRPPVIPGGSAVVFEAELLGVSKTPSQPLPPDHPPVPKQ